MKRLLLHSLCTTFSLAALPAQDARLAADPVAALDLQKWVTAWESDLGPGWTAWWNANGTPHALFGPGAQVDGRRVRDLESARAAARSILTRHGEWFGVKADDIRDRVALVGNMVVWLQFDQMHRGVPVHRATVDFRFNLHDGGLAMAGSDAVRGLDVGVTPRLTADEAKAIFSSQPRYRGVPTTFDKPELWIYRNDESAWRLTWMVKGEMLAIETCPSLYIDALTGAVLGSEENLHYCAFDLNGNVKGNLTPPPLPDLPQNPPQLVPMKGVRVNVPGVGFAFTDQNGDFTIPYSGTTDQPVTINLQAGQWWNVADSSGTPINSASGTLLANGTPVNFTLNPVPSEFTTAQNNGAHYTQAIHDYVKAVVPSMPIDQVINVNVNLNQTCNAFFSSGGTPNINFYRVGGGCTNTCNASVVAHEYGHNTDFRAGGIGNSGLSEAIGDIHSIYLLDDPVIGRYFRQTGSPVRDATNTYTWPIVTVGHQEVHLQGQVFMGFGWDFLNACRSRYGAAPGYAIAETAMFESLLGNANFYPDCILQVCIADDNDANLNNGTPHIDAIHQAATGRHFIRAVFQAIDIVHTPLADTTQTSGWYGVAATINPKIGTVTGATLWWSTGGAFTPVAMTLNGNNATGAIPAISAPGNVRYYLEATSSLNNTRRLPSETGDAFTFAVGSKTQVRFDNFDAGAAGWTTGATTGSNQWRLGAPRGRDFDPTAAFSGTACYCTDTGNTSERYSGTAANTFLQSPAINCTGRTGVRLRLKRWLTLELGDFGAILVNGNQVWINTAGMNDQDWTSQDIAIGQFADNNAAVTVRFELRTANTNANNPDEVGGWNVDNVEIYSLVGGGCLAPVAYGSSSSCTPGAPALGTSGGFPQIGNSAFGYDVTSGPANTAVLWLIGTTQISAPTPNGTLLVLPTIVLTGTTDGSGAANLNTGVPNDPSLVGGTAYAQAGLLDVTHAAGFCLTNGIRATFCQ